MSLNKPIQRIAIVGTGVIGASWAAQYLARGFDVVATDPAPNADANLRKYVDEAWGELDAIGLSPGASRDRLSFTSDMKEALAQADFVQENAPERPEFKMKLFADMDAATPPDSFIASSSSGITPSVMQSKCKRPERVLVLGCGSVAQCTLPLLIRDLSIDPQRITIVDMADTRARVADSIALGVAFEHEQITPANLDSFLTARVGPGDLLLDLAWNIDNPTILQWCRDHGVRYLNTSVEVWNPYDDMASTHPACCSVAPMKSRSLSTSGSILCVIAFALR